MFRAGRHGAPQEPGPAFPTRPPVTPAATTTPPATPSALGRRPAGGDHHATADTKRARPPAGRGGAGEDACVRPRNSPSDESPPPPPRRRRPLRRDGLTTRPV